MTIRKKNMFLGLGLVLSLDLLQICQADERLFSNFSNSLVETVKEAVMEFFMTPCQKDLKRFYEDVQEPWALQMLDSFGKLESGLLTGNIQMTGSERACLRVTAPSSKVGNRPFTGKYCQVYWDQVPRKSQMMFRSGVCIPSSCKEGDIRQIFPLISKLNSDSMLLDIFKIVRMRKVICFEEPHSLPIGATITLFIIGMVIFVGISATIFHYIQQKLKDHSLSETQLSIKENTKSFSSGSGTKSLLACFSAFENCSAILARDERDPALSFLHGVRVLSFCWVVIGHVYGNLTGNHRNFTEYFGAIHNFSFQFIPNGIFAVDTFLFMGGFLFTYLLLKSKETAIGIRRGILLLIHRYLRSAPTMLLSLAISTNVLPVLGRGPYWKRLAKSDETCHKSWWTFLLYINNFFEDNDLCGSYYWYLAVDFQLCAVGIIVLSIYMRNRTAGFVSMAFVVVVTFCVTGYIIFVNGYATFVEVLYLIEKSPSRGIKVLLKGFRDLYVNPYNRAIAYIFGILCAIFISQQESKHKRKISRPWPWVLLSMGMLLFVIFFPYFVARGNVGNSIFIPSCFVAWSMGIAFLFYACICCQHGTVRAFLSWPWWRPLSRLTYSAYLLHIHLLLLVHYDLEHPIAYSHKPTMTMTIGLVVMTFGVSFIFTALFEAPFIRMTKLLLQRNSSKAA